MTKDEHVKYWCETSLHDFESAASMFDSTRYDWCLFAGHLALEKILKAIFIDRNGGNIPPKIHNLVRLAELAKIELDVQQKFILDKINDFNLQARYPYYKFEFYKRCTEEYTSEYFMKIKELHEWLSSLLK